MDNWDKIFRAYDIRGIYPSEINKDVAYSIGRAVARFLILKTQDQTFKIREQRVKNLIVARDNRLSSQDLFEGICDGLRNEKINVIDIGITTSPMFYYSVIKMNLGGGIMITASHNPKQYNGFKIVKKNAMPINQEDMKEIKALIRGNNFDSDKNQAFLIGRNALKSSILNDYVEHIIDFSHLSEIKPLKVIADTGNATAGIIVNALIPVLPIKLEHLFPELDGDFPNHDPNPVISENTKILQEKVLSQGADLGIALDGDGDRIMFVNEKGQRVDPDLIAAIIIHYYFKRGGKILCTAVSSRIVKDEAMDSGNEVIIEKVGHTFIRKRMAQENVVFACESSGHYYFKDSHYIESPFLIFLKILELISRTKMPLSDLVGQFQRFCQERIAIPFSDINKARFCIKKIEAEYKKIRRYGRIGKFSYVDGVSFEYPDWWFNVRISNTEPLIRLTIEADNKELLEEKRKEIQEMIKL